MIKALKIGVCIFCSAPVFAQTDSIKTVIDTTEVIVRGFEQNRRVLTTASISTVRNNAFEGNTKSSLVQAVNTVAGVRMEERSPGSYRLSIRGSSLRAPFGVRNVKMYYEGIPVTDPGGNTYLNAFAINNFYALEILKGPGGSLYGAGTGGVILASRFKQSSVQRGETLELIGGNYGLRNIFFTGAFGDKLRQNSIELSHTQTDGYRMQSAMKRTNVALHSQIKASEKQTLMAHFWYTDLQYQTPGALTWQEFDKNPSASRPAVGALPSAEQAHAAIYQKNVLVGVVNEQKLNSKWQNTTALYGSFSQIKNPAIRNYEQRSEPHFGGRSFFKFQQKKDGMDWQWITGAEFQKGFFNTRVSRNKNGQPDSLFTNDDISLSTGFLFTQADFILKQVLFVTVGLSVNSTNINITRTNTLPVKSQESNYNPTTSPRVSLVYKLKPHFSLNATFSKGFSPPTLSELLPSTGIINTALNPELGTNIEAGAKWQLLKNRVLIELTGYHFQLSDALVSRRDASGADYFINGGSTRQTGVETMVNYFGFAKKRSWFEHYNLNVSYTFSAFKYSNFIQGSSNFSGKVLPGTPRHAISTNGLLQFHKSLYLQLNYFYASGIYLNDANTAKDDAYGILGGKIGWPFTIKKWGTLDLYAGADNLTNTTYSLGNDINAAGGRYFNAAPGFNFFMGIKMTLSQKSPKN